MMKPDDELPQKISFIEQERDVAAIKAKRFEQTFGAISPYRDNVDAYDSALRAMKKRLPMLIKQKAGFAGQCPSCNGNIKEKENFCGHCGQLLDWRYAFDG